MPLIIEDSLRRYIITTQLSCPYLGGLFWVQGRSQNRYPQRVITRRALLTRGTGKLDILDEGLSPLFLVFDRWTSHSYLSIFAWALQLYGPPFTRLSQCILLIMVVTQRSAFRTIYCMQLCVSSYQVESQRPLNPNSYGRISCEALNVECYPLMEVGTDIGACGSSARRNGNGNESKPYLDRIETTLLQSLDCEAYLGGIWLSASR